MAASTSAPARIGAAKARARGAKAKPRPRGVSKTSAKAVPPSGAAPKSPPPAARAAAAPGGPPATVGVRELRQNLSVYLDRVKRGEALQVTEHGRVVAILTAVPPTASRYDILLAQGLITPATRSIRDLPPPRPMPPGARPLSEILDELREERL
jgi:prevent-host-death family protein